MPEVSTDALPRGHSQGPMGMMPFSRAGDGDAPVNPRYANYARIHGRSVAGQLVQDRKDWPGGIMAGFTLWNQKRLREYAGVNPNAFYHVTALGNFDSTRPPALMDHEAYDAWLDAYPEQDATP